MTPGDKSLIDDCVTFEKEGSSCLGKIKVKATL